VDVWLRRRDDDAGDEGVAVPFGTRLTANASRTYRQHTANVNE
jgi:hypothetical protein